MRNGRTRRYRIAGFSLIELLVVAAIIAILMSLLLPGLRTSKDMARAMACCSNLKQFGVANHLYAGDYGDWLPQFAPYGYTSWATQIATYISATKVVCPVLRDKPYFNSAEHGTYALNSTSGQAFPANASGWRYDPPRKLSRCKRPASIAWMLDKGGTPPSDVDRYFGHSYGEPGSVKFCVSPHQNGFCCLYVDGRAEKLKTKTVVPYSANYGIGQVFWGWGNDWW